jgi:hypothetical protein
LYCIAAIYQYNNQWINSPQRELPYMTNYWNNSSPVPFMLCIYKYYCIVLFGAMQRCGVFHEVCLLAWTRD